MADEHDKLTKARLRMVEQQIKKRGIKDERVLEAMRQVPRHKFVAPQYQAEAYHDRPLPIGQGQTISQPYIVAYMTESLNLPDGATVLEIGTGSGYQAAILSHIAAQVYSIERLPALADKARHILEELGIDNVEVAARDGGYGWPEHAPYDGIIVTAGAPEIPAPLRTQLREDGGTLIVPSGPRWQQQLLRLERHGDKIQQEKLAPVAFVPLIGEHGWESGSD